MSLLKISEVFGYDVTNHSSQANRSRDRKWCPFRDARCNKGNLEDPLGICSFGNTEAAGVVCPNRFLEGEHLFRAVARLAFGSGAKVLVAPEIRILRVAGKRSRRIGKVDYIIARLDSQENICDFAALEVQAVYFSGRSIKQAFHHYLRKGDLPEGSERRLDYRSSAQKRLMPQLNLKVPVFRRWGKKFFVAVDSLFFQNLPALRTVGSLAHSEITWVVYPFRKQGTAYRMGTPSIQYTLWEDVLTALREGQEPTPEEVMQEISERRSELKVITV